MKPLLTLLLAALALPVRAAAPPDPIEALMAGLSAPTGGERLARVQADLIAAAEGFEALRAPAHAAAAEKKIEGETDPALRPFVKDRDASLNAVYRTLAVFDFTWALRFPPPPCAAAARRQALLQSGDGLFVDPDVGALSPWMARLLGPSSFGAAPEEALDQASLETKPTASAYEKMRVEADQLTAKLAGPAVGAERAGLYCARAELYERLARSHRPETGPIPASLASAGGDPADSVFLLTAANGGGYDVLGAGFLILTSSGTEFVTDASVVRGRKNLYAFAHPSADAALGTPIPVVIERSAPGVGPAVGRLDIPSETPALTLAATTPPVDEVVRGLGPLRAAGPWTTTQGLVTSTGVATFPSDAVLSPEMAGSPVLNEGDQAAGLMIRRGAEISALRPEKLHEFLDGGTGALPDEQFVPSRNTGSASILTPARLNTGGNVRWTSSGSHDELAALLQPRQ